MANNAELKQQKLSCKRKE